METNNTTHAPTVLYLSHGGGPLPLLGDEGHNELVENLKTIATEIKKPSAIIVISAHWEENRPTITGGKNPALIYDYSGFPEESYKIQYPAKGEPELASKIYSLLKEKGIETYIDEHRGFDHGLFVPLKIMFPDAEIPCIQMSLVSSLDPGEHIKIGQALSGLKHDNLLVIGSGFSFHNMGAFFKPSDTDSQHMNMAFETWLIDTCSNITIDENERAHRLKNWIDAPFARYCHPREEHLLPLHVCYGVAGRACSQFFEFTVLGKKASAYLW